MFRFIRLLFSNAVVCPVLLGLLGVIFWIVWRSRELNDLTLTPGRNSQIVTVFSLSWPYFLVAAVSNLVSWRFAGTSENETPSFVYLFNFIATVVGIFFLFLGPFW